MLIISKFLYFSFTTLFLFVLDLPVSNSYSIYSIPQTQTSTTWTDLYNYTSTSVEIQNVSSLLIFGGIANATVQNALLVSYYENNTIFQLTINSSSSKPTARQRHCALEDNDRLYIYGGTSQSGTYLMDLWYFNIATLQWVLVSNSSDLIVKQCKLMKLDDDFYVVGQSSTKSLKILKYTTNSSSWSNLSYCYPSSISSSGLLYTNQTQNISVYSMDFSKQMQNQTFYDIFQSSSLALSNICAQKMSDTEILIFANSALMIMYVESMMMSLQTVSAITSNFSCAITDDYFLVFLQSSLNLNMRQFSLSDLSKIDIKLYQKQQQCNYTITLVDSDIYMLCDQDLSLYILQQDCSTYINTSSYIESCLYQISQCADGYRGQYCDMSICENTLILFDGSIFGHIVFQCSGHGNCTEQGCDCDDYWTGDDCSIFTRTNCSGTLVQNYPIQNCECEDSDTLGGNVCDVVFCYNDCSDQGDCQTTGECLCDTGYYGADCSISIIQFPSATLSI